MIKRAQQDEKIDAISDKFSTPTYTHELPGCCRNFSIVAWKAAFCISQMPGMQLAGIRAMGAGMLPQCRYSSERENRRRA